jgi:hypothetical protein
MCKFIQKTKITWLCKINIFKNGWSKIINVITCINGEMGWCIFVRKAK